MKDRLLDVPERYRGGLERYARHHIAPGQFLRLILEDTETNEAIARMDRDVTIEELRALLCFIHNDLMPGSCHGSPELVASWIARRIDGPCGCGPHEQWYESQPATGAIAVESPVPQMDEAGHGVTTTRHAGVRRADGMDVYLPVLTVTALNAVRVDGDLVVALAVQAREIAQDRFTLTVRPDGRVKLEAQKP